MRSVVFICAILFSLFLQGQSDWTFNHITTDDGLSTGTVNCVFKDSKGFIWIGTIDGLNLYDGYELTIFKNEKENPLSISGNIITAITEDKNGNLWVGTRNSGLNIFSWDTETFSPVNNIPGLLKGQVRALHNTFNDKVLIAIEGGGLILYNLDDNSYSEYLSSPGNQNALSNNTVLSVVRKSSKEYYVTHLDASIDIFNVESGTFQKIQYNSALDPLENNRKVILEDSNGTLWLGTDGKGLIKINRNNEVEKVYNTSNSGLTSNIITTLYQAQDGFLYVGTDGNGINVINTSTEEFTYLESSLLDPNSLSSNAIYQIYEDDSGVVWVSTFRGGVNTYSPYRSKFKFYKQIPYETNSLSFASVIDVFETQDGYIWIGTDGGGLDQLDPRTGRFRHYSNDPNNPNSISSNVAIAIEEDSNGYLWIGSYAGGVSRFNRSTGIFRRFLPDPNDPSSINSKNVWHILEDSKGTLWFGLLNGGLDKYDPVTESFSHFEADGNPGSISSNLIYTMLEDSRGNFWIGTEGEGLNLFDRDSEKFTYYKHNENDTTSLLNNIVRTIFEDSKGQLWIGSSEGINILDLRTKEITRHKVNALLPSRVVNGIQEDGAGNLWIASNKGLSKYNPKNHTIRNFTKSDGLQGNEFNYTSSIKSRNGTMYFGGVKGLNAFNPSQVKMSQFQPNVVLTDIKLFDKSITEVKDEDRLIVDTSIQSLEKLTLNHDQNVLELAFSSLDFTSPHSNIYRYKMEGFDKDWMYTDAAKRTASYTNLDPGSYTFYVEGTNSDGIWSPNGVALDVTVTPPWWQTWWFRTLAFVVVILTAYFFIRWRARTNKHQKEELQRQIEEATSKVTIQNQELQAEQGKLKSAIEETNFVVNEAVESGNFSARINLDDKTGAWKDLGQSINTLFDSIVLPFNRITEIVGAMASSNLTLRYDREAKGDILKLTSSLDYALNSLSDLIATIKQTTTVVGHLSDEMNTTSKEMQVGTSEIASSTSELSRGAQEQVSRIDESSNKLENIMEFSSSVGEQAQSINQAAKRGVSLSTSGQGEMKSMDDSMQKMEQASSETGDSIAELLEKSAEISSILNSIKEISVETNMLALNAAIEAAKAGESGRGFAVVADQIRRLAENSSSFATEIEAIVSEVQSSISSVSERVSEMNNDIKESVSASQNASNSFTELASSYEETFNLSEKIVVLTDHQFEKVKEVVQLMESVVVIAEEAAAGTEEIASSANELSSGMTEYQDRTDKVSDIIKLLNDKMNQFKLSEE